MRPRTPIVLVLALIAAAVIAWGALRFARAAAATVPISSDTPVTRVKRGSVAITVSAAGALQGANAETLAAPTVAQDTLNVTFLREPGELVQPGDVVAEFDTTQQEYNLKEAESDLAEANENLAQTEAANAATEEENYYTVEAAKAAVKTAEQDIRRKEVEAALSGRLHEIALEAAQNHLKQAEQDQINQKKSADAALAIQKANQSKAKVSADLARKNIESMTLKAKTGGYVSVSQNTFNMFILTMGMTLPPIQIGDTVRPGMMVAQIPDMGSWEVAAQIPELDRGHLVIGQAVKVSVVALAGETFSGRVKSLGNTSGQAWNRTFDCRISLDRASPNLRPGMSSNLIITAETLDDVLWVPSQALFERDGRSFVYLRTANGFTPHDVALVNRSESQAVLTGLNEGDAVALSNPSEQKKPPSQQQSATKAMPK
jgi:multidrug efflux pump subunit AcrA (membrane-fusion protein)